jgi:hypothetical protein
MLFNADTFLKVLETEEPKLVDKITFVRHTSEYFDLWYEQYNGLHTKFDEFQNLQRGVYSEDAQKKPLEKKNGPFNRQYIASFIQMPYPAKESLFVGIYTATNYKKPIEALEAICPVNGLRDQMHWQYDFQLTEHLDKFRTKLFVGFSIKRGMCFTDLKKNPLRILQYTTYPIDKKFPGWERFFCLLEDFNKKVSKEWKTELSKLKGIYLITCLSTGKQYVGKADGKNGFCGRFEQYCSEGHGGNKEMKTHNFTEGKQVSILEVLYRKEAINERESFWKEKLFTRKFGLNAN